MEEAHSKTEQKRIASHEGAVKAKQQGYQRGPEDHTEFFREFLETLTPDAFLQEGYFEAYIKYVDDHCCARVLGEDLEQVEFQLPAFEDAGVGEPKDTAPLDGEAVTNKGTDDEDPTF